MLRAAGAEVADRERRHPGDDPRRAAGAPGHGRAGASGSSRARSPCPGDFSSAAFFIVAAAARPRQRGAARGRRDQPGPDRPARDPDPDGRRGRGGRDGGRGARAGGDDRRPLGAAARRPGSARARCRWRSTSCRWSRWPACFAEGETVVTGAEELRHKESDRIATVVERPARARAPRSRRPSDGFAVAAAAACAAGRSTPRGDHRLAMLGAVAGLASRRGRRGARASRPPRSATRASSADLRRPAGGG